MRVISDNIAIFTFAEAGESSTLGTFDQDLARAIRQLEQLENAGERSDFVHVLKTGIVGLGFALGDQQDLLVIRHRGI